MAMQNATSERSAMTISDDRPRLTIYKREGISEREPVREKRKE